MLTIGRKGSDQFESQYKGSTEWFYSDQDFLKEDFPHLKHTTIQNSMKRILKV